MNLFEIFLKKVIDSPQAMERMRICVECPKFNEKKDICNQCGCNLQLKTLIPIASCPLGKW